MEEKPAGMKMAKKGSVTVVELLDRKILDELSISTISDKILALVDQKTPAAVVVDFAKVDHMSSSALGMLITLHKRVREHSGQLRLCNIQPSIYEIFTITRLNEVFHICKTREEAIGQVTA